MPESPGALRLLTLNAWLLRLFRWRLARDFTARAARLPEAVAATGADVVALQEVWPPAVGDTLANGFGALGYAHVVAGARRTPARVLGDGLMIVSRHPLSPAGHLRFSRSSVWYEALIGKGALAADVTLPSGTLRVVTAHLGVVRYDVRRAAYRERDSRTRRAQVEELALWIERLPGRPEHLVLAGDLNVADHCAPDHRHLVDRLPLVDAYREHDPAGAGFTFDPATNAHAARGRLRDVPGQRIDYVLYRADGGLSARAAALAFRDPPPLSDHYGLLVDFDVQRPKMSASSAGGVTSS